MAAKLKTWPSEGLFQKVTLLTGYWGLIALFATGQLPLKIIVICVFLMALSSFRSTLLIKPHSPVWAILNICAFVTVALYAYIDTFMAVMLLLIYIQLNRLFNATRTSEYTHIYIIAFFQVLFASVLTASVNFAIIFLVFLFLFSTGLTLLIVRKEGEYVNRLKKKLQLSVASLRRETGPADLPPKVFLYTGLSYFCILFLTTGLFLFIPRYSAQQLFKGLIKGRTPFERVTGFGDDIVLGAIGSIAEDPSIVMRIKPLYKESQKSLAAVHVRANAFDHYDGKRWLRSKALKKLDQTDPWAKKIPFRLNTDKDADLLQQIVYLEPFHYNYLFAINFPVRFNLNQYRKVIVNNEDYSTRYFYDEPLPLTYTAYSYIPLEPEKLYQAGGHAERAIIPSRDWRMRFQSSILPFNQEREQIELLTNRITTGQSSFFAKALAIQDYLRSNFKYTLTPNLKKEKAPLSQFLFRTRQGHCEYFATAMAYMLRTLGIPSRLVNGFYSAEWNPYGKYFVIRESHAHTWVEAWLTGYGWVSFDPTPQERIGTYKPFSPWFYTISHLYDTLKIKWYNYVIDYDLNSQKRLRYDLNLHLEAVVRQLMYLFSLGFYKSTEIKPHTLNFKALALLIIFSIGLMLTIFLAIRHLYHGKKRTKHIVPNAKHKGRRVEFYLFILRILRKKGYIKLPGQTPWEFALRVAQAKKEFDDFVPITQFYYQLRYSAEPLSPPENALIENFLQKVKLP